MSDDLYLTAVLGGAGLFLLYAFLRIFWPGRDAGADPARRGEDGFSTDISFGGAVFQLGESSGDCGDGGGD